MFIIRIHLICGGIILMWDQEILNEDNEMWYKDYDVWDKNNIRDYRVYPQGKRRFLSTSYSSMYKDFLEVKNKSKKKGKI